MGLLEEAHLHPTHTPIVRPSEQLKQLNPVQTSLWTEAQNTIGVDSYLKYYSFRDLLVPEQPT